MDVEALRKEYGDVGDWQAALEKDLLTSDLLSVGPQKPLGYLPASILEFYKRDPLKVRKALQAKGLKVAIYADESGPWLYAWSETAMQSLLNKHRKVLEKYDWPLDPTEFIKYLHTYNVQPNAISTFGGEQTPGNFKPLFNLIALVFGNPQHQK